MQAASLLLLAVIFHLFAFVCIFDIYFSSPIDPDIDNVYFTPVDPPAKRLVFFIADGLRADTCFQFLGRDERYHDAAASLGPDISPREKAFQAASAMWSARAERTSFLRETLEQGGSWGVSHARVPTETRPGHVAVIAGFYEDVSAITKGWQDNPVDFDHVFNQSRFTWAWGSPDVTRMFARKLEHVQDFHYASDEEDFAREDLSMLDTWVFNRVQSFLEDAKTNRTLKDKVEQDKVVFFLHLLGIDCNGHAHRPHSGEYMQNMASVDRGVNGIVQLFERQFPDERTAYVFTSDHGMGNNGAHGDGDPTNTRTPVIAWGAGVRASRRGRIGRPDEWPVQTGFSVDEEVGFSVEWGLEHLERRDMEQADIAPLMSALIGIPVPANSIGMLPMTFLERGSYRSSAIVSNAKQLVKQVRFKERARAERLIWFQPFEVRVEELEAQMEAIEEAFERGSYDEVESECALMIKTCLKSLRYYQTYDRLYLIALTLLGYTGWILYAPVEINHSFNTVDSNRPSRIIWVVRLVFAALGLKQAVERAPLQYYIYLGFPFYLFNGIATKAEWFDLGGWRYGFVLALGLQLMVAGYSYRSLYAMTFTALGGWIFTVPELQGKRKLSFQSHTGKIVHLPAKGIKAAWAVLCTVVGSFTLLSLDVNDRPGTLHDRLQLYYDVSPAELLALGAALMLAILCAVFATDMIKFSAFRLVQLCLIALASYISLSTDLSLKHKTGLPVVNQALTWITFPVSIYLPVNSYKTPLKRFLSCFAGIAPPLILLSVNYEVLFFALLGALMYLWLLVERCIMFGKLRSKEARSPGAITVSNTLAES